MQRHYKLTPYWIKGWHYWRSYFSFGHEYYGFRPAGKHLIKNLRREIKAM